MQTLKTWWVAGLVGGLGLVGACTDDSTGEDVKTGGNGGIAAEGGTSGSGTDGGTAGANGGMSGDGGTGGTLPDCPTDLRSAPGMACVDDGQVCIDPDASCEHNWSVECVEGKWASLPGAFPPCGGAGGEGGAL